MPTRREFIQQSSLAGLALALPKINLNMTPVLPLISCQQYTWITYLQREGESWQADLDASFDLVTAAGLRAFEPLSESLQEVSDVGSHLKKRKISSPSLYVNSVLHDADQVATSMERVLSIAKAAKEFGTKIIVTNPSPIRWGGDEDKNDAQLMLQAKSLNQLGEKLRKLGLILAYHNHDAEMRQSGREFHHMMVGTDPENVKLCLDSHWIYRGAGNSQVAVFDIFELYANRVVELHLRQSVEGIWTETFGEGDIDYERLTSALLRKQIYPQLVLEQAVEEGTPQTLSPVEAHQQSLAYAQTMFVEFAKSDR